MEIPLIIPLQDSANQLQEGKTFLISESESNVLPATPVICNRYSIFDIQFDFICPPFKNVLVSRISTALRWP